MGHEILYAVASPTLYALTYSGGPGTIAAPYFNWDHVCHNTPPGCADDHGYNDGFAHFVYDGVVQIYGIGYIGSPGYYTPGSEPLFLLKPLRKTLGQQLFPGRRAEDEEDQVYLIFKKIVQLKSIAHFRLLMADNPLNTGIIRAWNNNLRESMSLEHQVVVRNEASDLYISLP